MPRRPRSPSSGSGDANDKSKRLPHQRPEDDKLIALYNHEGEQAYLWQVYVYCRPGVISFLRRFVASEYQHDVEDITQESFANFIKMVKGKKGRQFPLPQPFNHLDYIREIARNEYLKRLDKEKKVPTVSLSSVKNDDEQEQVNSVENEASLSIFRQDEFDDGPMARELRENINKLREPYRTTMLLKMEQLSDKEIAGKMGVSVGNVKTWANRGRKMLGQFYRDEQKE
jgi:RNA polymerase sigma factor (sigma-70 family)